MTHGITEFINQIIKIYNPGQELIKELKDFIIESNCPKIRFEKLSKKAAGISKTDECVISTIILNLPFHYFLYIVLHEISHQYQYKKYGSRLAYSVYINDNIEESLEILIYLEKIADRLAIKKTKNLLKLINYGEFKIIPRYLNIDNTEYLKNYISEIQEEIIKLNIYKIEDINNLIYQKIKE